MANKREIVKLRELLKKSESLVQDLQDELDMKDSMTVKELQHENYGSQDTCDHSFSGKELHESSPEKHMDNSPRIDRKESHDKKEEESSESMSKIEAELEAELERLGLDMNASSLERKLSELVEVSKTVAFSGNFTILWHKTILTVMEISKNVMKVALLIYMPYIIKDHITQFLNSCHSNKECKE